ncbi:hypothetical protein [Halanaerobaculum tunisiense]
MQGFSLDKLTDKFFERGNKIIHTIVIPLTLITDASIPMAIGAVFSGGTTFGDVTSQLSEMTVMAVGATELNFS